MTATRCGGSQRRPAWTETDAASLWRLGALAVLTAACLPWDVEVSRWLQTRREVWPGEIWEFLDLFELFGHAWGAAAICVSLWVLFPSQRYGLPRFAVCVFGAGGFSALMKLLMSRWRPDCLDLTAPHLQTFLWSAPPGVSSELQSFPSGHTALAVALAIACTWWCGRGRWLFLAFAGLVAVQRVAFQLHYPSDVAAGALLGCLWARVCFNPRLAGSWFGRWESRELTPAPDVNSSASGRIRE